MNSDLLSILACPECGGDLVTQQGQLFCTIRKSAPPFRVFNGIPRFVQSDSYVSSFSLEWSRHRQTQLDSVSGLRRAEELFFARTGLTPAELKGKLVLDAGCGIGRFAEVVTNHGGRVVGLDLSYSVDAAAKNVPGASFVQGDILRLPFKQNAFDIVFSLGVIHHTPSAEKALCSLTKVVKPGGKLAVWVYGNDGFLRKGYNAIAACYRTVTTRIPEETLYRMCKVAVPLYHVHKTLRFTEALFPISMEENPEWRVLDTFDWYAPKYQSKHSYREVESWFKGFKDVRRLPTPTSVVGVKV